MDKKLEKLGILRENETRISIFKVIYFMVNIWLQTVGEINGGHIF